MRYRGDGRQCVLGDLGLSDDDVVSSQAFEVRLDVRPGQSLVGTRREHERSMLATGEFDGDESGRVVRHQRHTGDVDTVGFDRGGAVTAELVVADAGHQTHLGTEARRRTSHVAALASRFGVMTLREQRRLTRRLVQVEQVEVHVQPADDHDPTHCVHTTTELRLGSRHQSPRSPQASVSTPSDGPRCEPTGRSRFRTCQRRAMRRTTSMRTSPVPTGCAPT